ncbi:MAG: hypothetical protein K9N09_04745 [Candidatus Cloacimonetes bacterium]|nr:hypothetical protein [Candidatus Cloacimonadota bacterium]MCF7815064.1 hypothetical protein [Candidatus Cloacimonadota bacterium]MCF7867990.1 hypothetical protein [Candidatus Cloacimonadota bacterium]MCF7883448.1 hypothetical protein [Candidatus Cloacimonadota bacterium]
MKKGLIIIIIIIVAAGIVFFSLFWPLDKAEDMKGTIGGVEKAKKFRGDQLDDSDLLLENDDFVALTQSAEWQNAMKNEEVVKFMQSEEFSKFIILATEWQKAVYYSQGLLKLHNHLENQSDLTPEKVRSFLASDNFQAIVFSQDVQFSKFFMQDFQKFVVHWNLETIQTILFSADMNLVSSDEALKNLYENDTFKSVYSQDFQKWFSQDFQNIMFGSQDFQNAIRSLSQDFQKFGFPMQDFQKWFSQDFQNVYLSQDFQKVFSSQEFKILFNSQDIQKVFMSQDFQNYLKSGVFI